MKQGKLIQTKLKINYNGNSEVRRKTSVNEFIEIRRKIKIGRIIKQNKNKKHSPNDDKRLM